MSVETSLRTAVFGGGCFWCTEALYQNVPGVTAVVSGYAGGHVAHPTYEQVCSGRTGHAEVVQITYDPGKISYRELLDLFWKAHDPTTRDRQGADVGPQYRSIILTQSDAERTEAEASREAAQAGFSRPIVTEIAPLGTFYPAEAHHQDFYDLHRGHPYNEAVITPKLEKFRCALRRP